MNPITLPGTRGAGDIVEMLAKPIAKAMKMDCLDDKGSLKPDSPCGRRKRHLNRIFPAAKPQGK